MTPTLYAPQGCVGGYPDPRPRPLTGLQRIAEFCRGVFSPRPTSRSHFLTIPHLTPPNQPRERPQ
jgi:hypothetical protein